MVIGDKERERTSIYELARWFLKAILSVLIKTSRHLFRILINYRGKIRVFLQASECHEIHRYMTESWYWPVTRYSTNQREREMSIAPARTKKKSRNFASRLVFYITAKITNLKLTENGNKVKSHKNSCWKVLHDLQGGFSRRKPGEWPIWRWSLSRII